MSADLLRRAAEVLRKSAEVATPGPWSADRGTKHNWVVDGDPRSADHAWVALMMFGECEQDARYIALMHPPVALALADWLDSAARDAEEIGPDPFALRAARAVLREDPT